MSSRRKFIGTQCDGMQIKLTVLCDFLNRQGQGEVRKVVPPGSRDWIMSHERIAILTIPDRH